MFFSAKHGLLRWETARIFLGRYIFNMAEDLPKGELAMLADRQQIA